MTERTCPLGHTCDACLWQIEAVKEELGTGRQRVERNCALIELVGLTLYHAGQTQGAAAGIEQLRNRVAESQEQHRAMLRERQQRAMALDGKPLHMTWGDPESVREGHCE